MRYILDRKVEQMISAYEPSFEGEDLWELYPMYSQGLVPIEEKIRGLEETIRADPDFPRGDIGDHVRVDFRRDFVLELMDAMRSEEVDELYITESTFGHQSDGTFCYTCRLFTEEPVYQISESSKTLHPDTVLSKDQIITRFTDYKADEYNSLGFIDALLERLGVEVIEEIIPECNGVQGSTKGKLYRLK